MSDDAEAPAVPVDVRDVIDGMSDEAWQALMSQLARYALQKSRRFYWRTGRAGDLPDGEVTESLVSKAFVLWLGGRRRWRRDEYPDLPSFLKGVVDSLLSHSANGYDNRGVELNHDRLPSGRTPEGDLLAKERAAQADAVLAAIVDRSREDAVALDIIDAMRQGAATRRDIVNVTGRTADDIDNGLKRLRRTGASVARSIL